MATGLFQYRLIICNLLICFIIIVLISVLPTVKSSEVKTDNNRFTCLVCPSQFKISLLHTDHATRRRRRRRSRETLSSSLGGQYIGSVMVAPIDDSMTLTSNRNRIKSDNNEAVLSAQLGRISEKYSSASRSSSSSIKYNMYTKPYVKHFGKQDLLARYQPFTSNNAVNTQNMNPPISAQASQSITVQSAMPVSNMVDMDTNDESLQELQTDPDMTVGEVMQISPMELSKPDLIQTGSDDLTYTPPDYQPDSYTNEGYGYGYPYPGYQQSLPDITTPPIPVNKPTDHVGEPPPPPANPSQAVVNPPLPPPPPVVPVGPPAVGYYYLGQKFWVVPLFFSIYYIIYVIYLMLKTMKKHKAYYPENLHNAVIDGSTAVIRMHSLSNTVWNALATFNNS